jgi:hypothetical protein
MGAAGVERGSWIGHLVRVVPVADGGSGVAGGSPEGTTECGVPAGG